MKQKLSNNNINKSKTATMDSDIGTLMQIDTESIFKFNFDFEKLN